MSDNLHSSPHDSNYNDHTRHKENMADNTKYNYIKLAQFEVAVSEIKLNKKLHGVIERLIDQGLDINYKLTSIGSFKLKPDCLGSTALHFALDNEELDIFRSLLNHGADFTIKNNQGKTVVHQAMEKSFHRKEAFWSLQGKLEHPYIEAVLQKQISSKNSTNPCNKDGLSHFHAACMINNVEAVEFFLKNGELVNKAIDQNSKILPGYTPLHLAARYFAFEVAKLLLDYGANVQLKNTEGINPLLILAELNLQIKSWFAMGKRGLSEKVLNQIKACCKVMQLLIDRDSTYTQSNLADEIGFSCLHTGCFSKDSLAIDYLFKKGCNMAQSIRVDSPIWPGYTALHFAVKSSFDIAMYLLKNGANILAKDAKGITPLDLILELYDSKFIHSCVLTQEAWKNITFSDGKTKLVDVILAMGSRDTFKAFLKSIDAGVNINLPADSPIWPGFTPLHLALIFPDRINDIQDLKMDIDNKSSSQMYNCSIEDQNLYLDRIEVCMSLGADITVKNAEGLSPLHLAFGQRKDNIVDFLLLFHKQLLNPTNDAGLSHFHIACAARNTLLAEQFLLEGANINGRIPSSLSYQKVHDVECSVEARAVLQFQLQVFVICSKLNVIHMSAGSTPLHIAVAVQCPKLMNALLKHGADVYATDVNGLTSLHRILIVEKPQEFASCLDSITDLKDRTLEYGLSHLHVACLAGSENCVRKLLDHGANVEATVTYKYSKSECKKISKCQLEFIDPYNDQLAEPMSFLARYSGYRPIHFAVRANNPAVVKLLVEHGADILAKNAENSTPLYDAFADKSNICRDHFVRALEHNVALQQQIREETGLTMLHFLCFLIDLEAVREKLIEEVDVDARAREDSPLWAGCTPLHVLMTAPHDNVERVEAIITLMLIHGADVTAVDLDNQSPIHIADSLDCCHGIRAHSYIVNMLKAQKDFSINPVSCEGISHFHIACMWDVECVVEKFLTNGTDPNTPIDYFNKCLLAQLGHSHKVCPGGSSPLQLTIIYDSKKVFNFLLEWGVNLEAVDRLGRTPLYVAVLNISHAKIYFEELIKRKVDLNAENVYGTSPFGLLLSWDGIDEEIIKIFIKESYPVNSFNTVTDEGYLGFCISNLANLDKPRPTFSLLMDVPNILEIDGRGRNAIHNAVSTSKTCAVSLLHYLQAIDQLKQLGCNINLQNISGKTPLHLAIEFQNFVGVVGLLKSGVDINILDADNKPAFAYVEESSRNAMYETAINIFLVFVHQCQLCGIYVNELNKKLYLEFMKTRNFKSSYYKKNLKDLSRLEERKIGEQSVTFRDFLSETGAVAAYPHMVAEQRQAIDEFFRFEKNILDKEFPMFQNLLILQYEKACRRVDLLKKAETSFNILTCFELPYLCSVHILKFLSNRDLGLLIASTDEDWVISE